jgi:hypothetical protein
MRYLEHLPLWRDATALLLAIEQAVRHFPQYDKYTLGADLRRQAMGVCRLIVRAYNDKPHQARLVGRLTLAQSSVGAWLARAGRRCRSWRFAATWVERGQGTRPRSEMSRRLKPARVDPSLRP